MSDWRPIGDAFPDWGDHEIQGYERGPTRSEIEARAQRARTRWERSRKTDTARIDRGVARKRKEER